MPDDSSKLAIPEWQRKAASAPSPPDHANAGDKPTEENTTTNDEQSDSDPASSSDNDKSSLLEQAKTFLSDPEIRDATTSRKITFLESKGLTNDEINSLLGVSRNEDASSTSGPDDTSDHTETVTIKNSTASATATSTVPPSTSTSTTTLAPRDVPPIITYPEFLVNPSAQSKPPLMSLRSVLYTLYGAAGLGATFYGASEFLVKPMLKSLGDARHDLAETTLSNLSILNEKLEKNVSKIPAHISQSEKLGEEDEETDDAESITSDPTEVFHRDIATQTSPALTNEINDDFPTSSAEEDSEDGSLKIVDSHTKSLTQITSHLQELVSDYTTSGELDDSMRDRVSDLQTYLDGLKYSSYNSFLNNNAMYNNSYSIPSGDTSRSGARSKEEEAFSAFRTEIRGVKGALLSARNFPSGRPAGVTR